MLCHDVPLRFLLSSPPLLLGCRGLTGCRGTRCVHHMGAGVVAPISLLPMPLFLDGVGTTMVILRGIMSRDSCRFVCLGLPYRDQRGGAGGWVAVREGE